MFKKILFARLGAATVITALGLAACGDDSSSGSNQCEALTPECGYTVEDLCLFPLLFGRIPDVRRRYEENARNE